MQSDTLVIERTFNAPGERVWKAITDKNDMEQWYFEIADFKPEVGFEFQFSGGTENKRYLHLCKVLIVIPHKKLAYSWRYNIHQGDSLVTFDLFEEDGKTRLVLTHQGLETFPKDDQAFAKESFADGWTYIIGTSLKGFVEINHSA
jgi:uncharacterized protein YndB with AHSA1/START domain